MLDTCQGTTRSLAHLFGKWVSYLAARMIQDKITCKGGKILHSHSTKNTCFFQLNEKQEQFISKSCKVKLLKKRKQIYERINYSGLNHDHVISKANKYFLRFKYLHLLLRSTSGCNQKYNYATLINAVCGYFVH